MALNPSMDDDRDETPIVVGEFDAKAKIYALDVAMFTFRSPDKIETRPIPASCYPLFDANEELYVAYGELKARVDKLEKSVGTPCTRTTKEVQSEVQPEEEPETSIEEKVVQVERQLKFLQSTTHREVSSEPEESENKAKAKCDAFKDKRYQLNLIVDAKHNVARSERLKEYATYLIV